MILLFVYLFLAIGVSFLCSVLEAVLLSVTPAYVAELEQRHQDIGAHLRHFKEDIDKPLSAILSLNTIAHTVGAAGVGSQAQIVFGDAYVTVTSIILTLLILVVSEIIPKTIGANFWKALGPWATYVLKVLVPVMYPFVILSQRITKLISGKKQSRAFSRRELSALAELGVEEGEIREQQSRIVKNLIRLDSLRGKDIMTPRTVVVAFPESTSIESVLTDKNAESVARIPVYDKWLDEVTGYVLRDDIMEQYVYGKRQDPLRMLRRKALVLPDLIRIGDLFEKLLNQQEQMAIMINEYGGFSGVATVEDIVETLIGMDIVDEDDTLTNRRQMARKRWQERASRLGISEKTDSEDDNTI